ncbi:MAG: DUF433 domain-containing protein [Rhizomicrobium sp.]
MEFDRIAQKPEVMGGKACICGMRVTVSSGRMRVRVPPLRQA